MTRIFTILLFSAFSLAGSELPLPYGHVSPLFWYICLFHWVFWHKTPTIRVYSNIHCDFLGGTTTSRHNRWRAMSSPPLHSQFMCSWLQKVRGLRHQGQMPRNRVFLSLVTTILHRGGWISDPSRNTLYYSCCKFDHTRVHVQPSLMGGGLVTGCGRDRGARANV
ncbi:uncharacterized protein BJ212DRAFT_685207 [Suillus subaureus]|uniref:Secreted protein n=1 Tax=Suillus subaureus TaxID=48587 RepID=A0A9P7JI02_9AGAM|nr:uncharacterized protein BJ212DRAFT_685207 [Suillus subaureus]KAG1823499.1 hypothetical protein BJ212DRAFT_685207 [Suillus subaureus]